MPSVLAIVPFWVVDLIPGPTGPGGDGTHEVDLSASFAPGYAVIGAVGFLVIMIAAFVIATRRRLRRSRRK